jgi:hypothetical protein
LVQGRKEDVLRIWSAHCSTYERGISRLTLQQWSSRGRPVKLIDCKTAALAAAVRDIEKLKNTVGKETGHKGGIVTTFGLDGLHHALSGAWLVVEVGDNSADFFQNRLALTDYYNRMFPSRCSSSALLSSSSMNWQIQTQLLRPIRAALQSRKLLTG